MYKTAVIKEVKTCPSLWESLREVRGVRPTQLTDRLTATTIWLGIESHPRGQTYTIDKKANCHDDLVRHWEKSLKLEKKLTKIDLYGIMPYTFSVHRNCDTTVFGGNEIWRHLLKTE